MFYFQTDFTNSRSKKTKAKMPIRPAKYHDLDPAAKVLAAAFKDEALFGAVLHPQRDKYPDSMYLYFLRKLRVEYTKGSNGRQMLVSYQASADGQEECVTGIGYWVRMTAKPETNLYSNAAVKAAEWYNYVESFVYPDRALDTSKANILQQSKPFCQHHWTGTRAEGWYLDLLGIDPFKQKRGYGRELVLWGFDRAREEGVGCSVLSSAGSEPFYQSCGFDVLAGTCSDHGGDANPLRDVAGGAILFWDNGIEPVGVKKYGET